MAELASAAPTSGGVRSFTLSYSYEAKCCFDSSTFGRTHSHLRDGATSLPGSVVVSVYPYPIRRSSQALRIDSNTIGTIAAIAAINWGCAVQVMAAASIGSNLTFTPTSAQT